MSLLPGQILPQRIPFAKIGEDGSVIIEKNWWLFLYNISKNVLGVPSSGAGSGSPASPLDLMLLIENDITGADISVLKHQADSANVLTWLDM